MFLDFDEQLASWQKNNIILDLKKNQALSLIGAIYIIDSTVAA